MRWSLEPPDDREWEAAFPSGVGTSCFSAPALQRALCEAEGPRCERWFLRLAGPRGPLTFPFLGHRDRFRRWIVVARPIGYAGAPLERACLAPEEIEAFARALASVRIAHARWWLRPWCPPAEAPRQFRTVVGELAVEQHDTYAAAIEEDVDAQLATRLSETRARHLRQNRARGVETVARPSRAQLAEYVDLYAREHARRGWIGAPFTRAFFEVVASEMGDGGELAVVVADGRVVGGGVLFYDRTTACYFQGAVDRTAEGVHPHAALYEHLFRTARRRGLAVADLGGVNAGNDGLVRFKESFGAGAVPVTSLRWTSGARHLLGRSRSAG